MRDPWTTLGWLLCVIVGISLVLAPIVGVLMLRAHRNAVRRHAEYVERIRRVTKPSDVRADSRRGR